VEQENELIKSPREIPWKESQEIKKDLLVRLNESLNKLREDRFRWQSLSAADRERNPEVPSLLRQNQDTIMKIIVLDGENEQALLRRGVVPPKHLPAANRQRPHFVAELYRKNGSY
jgi:hypothetical protein